MNIKMVDGGNPFEKKKCLSRYVHIKRHKMYGSPKIHKQDVPIGPIHSMIKSAQHSMAKQLSILFEQVLNKYSARVLKDSSSFTNELRNLNLNTSNLILFSFDIVSLFANISLDKTIQV